MNYLADLYSSLFHKREEEILVESAAEIEKLPQEILLQILSYLSAKELIALSSTCRRFSNLINTDDFLPKLTLRVTESTKKSYWVGQRKYEKLFILSESINLYFKLPKTIGNYVTSLKLDCWEITIYEIRKAIKSCPQIKVLSLMYLVRNGVPEEITEKELIPLTYLDKLSIQGELKIVKCFKNLQVKELNIYRQNDFETHLDDVAEFIMSQKEMTVLELYHVFSISNLLLREELKHVSFRLEKLFIKYCTHYTFFCFIFLIASQKESIKLISIDEFGIDIIKFLTPFTGMKMLRLTLKESRPIDDEDMVLLMKSSRNTLLLPQVEDLEVYNYIRYLVDHFPNVKKLLVHGNDVDLSLWQFKHLEKLTVITKHLKKTIELNSQLKKLELIMYEYPKCQGTYGPFEYSSCKLDELKLVGFKNLDWLKVYLGRQDTNLKRLRIERCGVTDEIRELFNIHKDKIERLEIVEQDGKDIDVLTRRYL